MREKLFSVTKDDCRWDYYRGSGKGGQKRNKTSNCCRCTHIASGAVGKSEEGRSQAQNRKRAFRRMAETETFRKWCDIEAARMNGELAQIERKVEREISDPEVTVIEVCQGGKWVQE